MTAYQVRCCSCRPQAGSHDYDARWSLIEERQDENVTRNMQAGVANAI